MKTIILFLTLIIAVVSVPNAADKNEIDQYLLDYKLVQKYPHVKRFKQAGIKGYEGAKTCFTCHKTIHVQTLAGYVNEDIKENIKKSSHYEKMNPTSIEEYDCLVCHADKSGKAVSVSMPHNDNCISCHDLPDISKDVHYNKKIECIDCHSENAGHKISRMKGGQDGPMCQKCHTKTPHTKFIGISAVMNAHDEFIDCKICHSASKKPHGIMAKGKVCNDCHGKVDIEGTVPKMGPLEIGDDG